MTTIKELEARLEATRLVLKKHNGILPEESRRYENSDTLRKYLCQGPGCVLITPWSSENANPNRG